MAVLVALLACGVSALIGAIAGGVPARRRFARANGGFRCRVRVTKGQVPELNRRWRRRTIRARARWVHDVLLVQYGLLRPATVALPARFPDRVWAVCGWRVYGLGAAPLLLPVQLDDATVVEVAAAESDRTPLVGPFLAAAIPGLPKAQKERP